MKSFPCGLILWRNRSILHAHFHFRKNSLGAMEHGIYMSMGSMGVLDSLPMISAATLLLVRWMWRFLSMETMLFSMSTTAKAVSHHTSFEFSPHSTEFFEKQLFSHNIRRIFDKRPDQSPQSCIFLLILH